jgi:hypothetical protein
MSPKGHFHYLIRRDGRRRARRCLIDTRPMLCRQQFRVARFAKRRFRPLAVVHERQLYGIPVGEMKLQTRLLASLGKPRSAIAF